jgi:hypothetical protein
MYLYVGESSRMNLIILFLAGLNFMDGTDCYFQPVIEALGTILLSIIDVIR